MVQRQESGRPSRSRRTAVRVWAAAGGSGVSGLLALVLAHQHDTAGATMALIAALTVNAIASLSLALPGIITAFGRERVRSALTRACLEKVKPDDTSVVLKLLALSLAENTITMDDIRGALTSSVPGGLRVGDPEDSDVPPPAD